MYNNIKNIEYLNIWRIRIEARFGEIQFVNLFHSRIGRLAHTGGSNDACTGGLKICKYLNIFYIGRISSFEYL